MGWAPWHWRRLRLFCSVDPATVASRRNAWPRCRAHSPRALTSGPILDSISTGVESTRTAEIARRSLMSTLRKLVLSQSARATVIRVLVLVLALLPAFSGGIGAPRAMSGGAFTLPATLPGQEGLVGEGEEEYAHPAPRKDSRRIHLRRTLAVSTYLQSRGATSVADYQARAGHPRAVSCPRRDPGRWTPSRRGPPFA